MARRSLRPHLNQIRGWVRQGRTDAWIAHQLEATVQQIETFKKDNDLAPAEPETGEAVGADFDDEIDLRAEDDALVAAELEAAEARRPRRRPRAPSRRPRRPPARRPPARTTTTRTTRRGRQAGAPPPRPPRRARPRARAAAGALEGTFDHGEEGYGLWLDPAVTDNPIYAEHWAGHRPVEVTVEEDQIVIRRAGGDGDD